MTRFFLVLSVFIFIPKQVLADGALIESKPYSDQWDYANESSQQAFINYENGLQKMIISIGYEESSNDMVWFFPVPADPNKVVIDVVKYLPELHGDDVSKTAQAKLSAGYNLLQTTQLYTIPFYVNDNLLHFGGALDAPKNDIKVYEHLEKEGVTTEIITAKTADGLYNYLKDKGLKIEDGAIPVLDNYIGQEYSFVVSWIKTSKKIISVEDFKNNLENYFHYPNFYKVVLSMKKKYPGFNIAKNSIDYLKSSQGSTVLQELMLVVQNNPAIITATNIKSNPINQKGVFVTFPTKELYFPLLPTSVYGSKTIPASIKVIGHVTPKIFQDIKYYTTTNYYINGNIDSAGDLKNFYNGVDINIKYTKIDINAPAKFFTDDLWLRTRAPAKTYIATFFINNSGFVISVFLTLSSMLAGILAGLISFKYLRRQPIKLGLIGLANLLSLFGLLVTIIFVGTKNKNLNVEPIITTFKQQGYLKKKIAATILFIIFIPYLLVNFFLFFIIFNKLINSPEVISALISLFFSGCVPMAAIIIGFIIIRIKPEDKRLFEQLKKADYSTWSLQPKDKMKFVFIPVFSVLFLIISWLFVKLFGLLV
ncbi:MAG: hypothetical protein WCW27_00885 [Patescibacteria group bacterium]